jgi:hypothetical protein
MTSELEKKNTGTEIEKPEHDYFADYANVVLSTRIVGDLLVFSKFGDFLAGRDRTKLPLGTALTAIMPQLMTGWVRWEDNRPAEQLMGLIAKGFKPAKRGELGFLDRAMWPTDNKGAARDPWQLSSYLIFADPESGQLYTYTTTSRGGINALGELAKAYSEHCRQSPGEYPIAALGMGSYRHPDPTIGEVRYPIFKVIGWTPRGPADGLLGAGGEDDEGNGGAAVAEPLSDEREAVKPAPTSPRPAPKKQPAAPRI